MKAPASGNSTASPNTPLPGRMTISAPSSPPHTSSQRSRDTRSRSSHAASSVTSSGASMLIDVSSGTGMCCRPKKIMAEVTSSKVPRSTWKRGCATSKLAPGISSSHNAITSA